MSKLNPNDYYIVAISVLPEIILKVMEAKSLLESGKESSIRAVTNKLGISRSAFYKYKDSVFSFYEAFSGKTMTISLNLDDKPGILSDILNMIADCGANILTINQTIPLNQIANVTITIETSNMKNDVSELIVNLQTFEGVQSLKIIATE